MSKLSIKILKIVMIISLLSMVILGVTNIYVFKSIFSNLQTEAVDIVKDLVNSISGVCQVKCVSLIFQPLVLLAAV